MKSTEQHASDRAAQKEFANYYEFFSALQNVLKKWSASTNANYESDIPLEGVEEINWFQNFLASNKNQELCKKVFKTMRVQTSDGAKTLAQVIENVSRRDDFAIYSANKMAGRASGSSGAPDQKHCFNTNRGYLAEIIKQYQNDLKGLTFDYVPENGPMQAAKMQGEDELSYGENQLKNKLDTLSEGDLINAIIHHEKQGIKLDNLVNECKGRINDPTNYTFLARRREGGAYPPKNKARELYNCLFQLADKTLRAEFIDIYLGKGMDLDQILDNKLQSFQFLVKIISIDFIEGIDLRLIDKINLSISELINAGQLRLHSQKEVEEAIDFDLSNPSFVALLVEKSLGEDTVHFSPNLLANILKKYEKTNKRSTVVSCFRNVIIKMILSDFAEVIDSVQKGYLKKRIYEFYFDEIINEIKEDLGLIIKQMDDVKIFLRFIVLGNRNSFEKIFSFYESKGFLGKLIESPEVYRKLTGRMYEIYQGGIVPEIMLKAMKSSPIILKDEDSFITFLYLLSPEKDADWLNDFFADNIEALVTMELDYPGYLSLEVELDRFPQRAGIEQVMSEIRKKHQTPDLSNIGNHEFKKVPLLIAKGLMQQKGEKELEDLFEVFESDLSNATTADDFDLLFKHIDLDKSLFLLSKMGFPSNHAVRPSERYMLVVFFLNKIPGLKENQAKAFDKLVDRLKAVILFTGRIDLLYEYFPEKMEQSLEVKFDLPDLTPDFGLQLLTDISTVFTEKLLYTQAKQYEILTRHGFVHRCFSAPMFLLKLIQILPDQKERIYKDFMSHENNIKTVQVSISNTEGGHGQEVVKDVRLFRPDIDMSVLINTFPDHVTDILDAYDYRYRPVDIPLLFSQLTNRDLHFPVFSHLLKKIPLIKAIPNMSMLVFFCAHVNRLDPFVYQSSSFVKHVCQIAAKEEVHNLNQNLGFLKQTAVSAAGNAEFLYGDFLKILGILTPFFHRSDNHPASESFKPSLNLAKFVDGLPDDVSLVIFKFYKPLLESYQPDDLSLLISGAPENFRGYLYEMMIEDWDSFSRSFNTKQLATLNNVLLLSGNPGLRQRVMASLLVSLETPMDLVILGDRVYWVIAGIDGSVVIDKAIEGKLELTEKIFHLVYPNANLNQSNSLLKRYQAVTRDHANYSNASNRLSPSELHCWKLACIIDDEERVQAVVQAIRQHRPASTRATLLLSRAPTRERMEQELEQKVRDLMKPNP
jgi:hypothetical protein